MPPVDTRDFVPQRAIVTGSESGIGRSIAVALADLGCDVGITWYRDEEMGKETAELVRAAGRRAELAHLDLTDLPGAADVVDRLADALGGGGGVGHDPRPRGPGALPHPPHHPA